MKIDKSELVRRYHIIFSVQETLALRMMGELPPYGEQMEAELWVTCDELEHYKSLGCCNPEEIDRQLIEENKRVFGYDG